METWSFLIQHIVRGETVPSEQFAVPELAVVMISDGDDDKVRSTVSQSQASTSTRKSKGKWKQSSPPTTQTATTSDETMVTHSNLSNVMQPIISKADSLVPLHLYTGQHKIVHDFSCLPEGHIHAIPEESRYEFHIHCLNLVYRYRQRRHLFQQPYQTHS
ncbi:uncharacterized protein [Palaemon carinicauda]|uniref:uncharacterized protein n=1 Tax=Palaemon carinicauda TaxID=392227 RepID=UPI0035B600EC